jgi:hypothetical protein
MSRSVVMATWDDAPHLNQKDKDELYASYPPHMRDARTKGVPQLGSGAIYPVHEDVWLVDPFPIPKYWPRSYSLDVGWNVTAALWGAIDHETDTYYFYHEYYGRKDQPVVHAQAIARVGRWIPGVIDPAARGRAQKDGTKLVEEYVDLGLNLFYADNALEAGIAKVWTRLSTGKIKVFSTCQNFRREIRLYRRDIKGEIVKGDDHLMDDMRYWINTGYQIATIKDIADPRDEGGGDVDPVTGY